MHKSSYAIPFPLYRIIHAVYSGEEIIYTALMSMNFLSCLGTFSFW